KQGLEVDMAAKHSKHRHIQGRVGRFAVEERRVLSAEPERFFGWCHDGLPWRQALRRRLATCSRTRYSNFSLVSNVRTQELRQSASRARSKSKENEQVVVGSSYDAISAVRRCGRSEE